MIIIEILCYICGKEIEIICCPYLNICRHEKAKVFNLLRIGILHLLFKNKRDFMPISMCLFKFKIKHKIRPILKEA